MSMGRLGRWSRRQVPVHAAGRDEEDVVGAKDGFIDSVEVTCSQIRQVHSVKLDVIL